MSAPRLLAASAVAIALSLSGCGSSGSASHGSDFCNAAQNVKNTFNALSGLSATTSLGEVKTGIQAATAAIDSLDSSAPSDISTDTHTLRSALDGANTKVQSANDLATAGSAVTAIGGSDYTATGDRVDVYVKSHCGFSVNGSSSSGSAAPTDTGSSSTSTDTGGSSSSTDTGSSSTDTGSSSSSTP